MLTNFSLIIPLNFNEDNDLRYSFLEVKVETFSCRFKEVQDQSTMLDDCALFCSAKETTGIYYPNVSAHPINSFFQENVTKKKGRRGLFV